MEEAEPTPHGLARQAPPAPLHCPLQHQLHRRVRPARGGPERQPPGQRLLHRRLRKLQERDRHFQSERMEPLQCALHVCGEPPQRRCALRLQPCALRLVLHRPPLHPPFLEPHAGPYQGRPQAAFRPRRARGVQERAVPEQEREHAGVQHPQRAQPRLLSQRARPLQPRPLAQRRRQAPQPREALGRHDAQARHLRLRNGQHRVYRVLDARPLHQGPRRGTHLQRRPLFQPRRNQRGHPQGRKEVLRERTPRG